ncbi:hypothetical protein ABT115_22160 [Streptomyces sp. NPDC001832]|uniref:hypothetical protein n=1 Tax=Streptomyces sp. NPDC001832 TaxID=3154527 RepID=UPI0033329660
MSGVRGTLRGQRPGLRRAHVRRLTSTVHRIGRSGVHVLKFWMVDPTVVPQNLVVDTGGLEPRCLGPPGSLRLRWAEGCTGQ